MDLRVSPGEVLGLVGANGAGKTTLMRTLLDSIRPTSGSLTGFGHESGRDSVAVRRLATYLPGELVIPSRLTGAQATGVLVTTASQRERNAPSHGRLADAPFEPQVAGRTLRVSNGFGRQR